MQRAQYYTASVWGLNVRYIDTGSGEAGDRPVALLLHGLAASLLTWNCNIDALTEAGYRVIAPDLPGYGDSDKPEHLDYSPDSAAEFVYDFCQELGLERLYLVGSSAGGLIAGLLALEHPKLVEKMMLVGSGGFGLEVSWYLRAISLPVVGDLFYQPWLNKMMGATKHLFYEPPAILKELLPEMDRFKQLPGARTAMLRSVRSSINVMGLRKEWYILERLKDSTVPLMTVWGAEDIIIPVSHADNVRRELPSSIVRVIPECGHWPQMEKPDQFNPMLTSFLGGSPVPPAPHDS
jgi:4,5:9,10-diseco-3-hydroxy-5,9,17-trioxoandrosta-1(10),2-diene-4-oate hydrolase